MRRLLVHRSGLPGRYLHTRGDKEAMAARLRYLHGSESPYQFLVAQPWEFWGRWWGLPRAFDAAPRKGGDVHVCVMASADEFLKLRTLLFLRLLALRVGAWRVQLVAGR